MDLQKMTLGALDLAGLTPEGSLGGGRRGGQGTGDRLASVSLHPPPALLVLSRGRDDNARIHKPLAQTTRAASVVCVSGDNRCLSQGSNCLKPNWTAPTPHRRWHQREGALPWGIGGDPVGSPLPDSHDPLTP